jgi:hypothetical protein
LAGRVPARLSAAEGRKFGLTVGLAFAALAGITWWRDHALLMQIFGGLATALILAGLVIPGWLGPVYRGWMGFAHLISKVTTPIRPSMASLFREFWAFLRVRKKWWLLPIIVVMVLVGGLLVFAQGSALAPFIYTIF